MNVDVSVFVQARLGSTRLPNKVCKMIGPFSLLAWCLRAMRLVPAAHHWLLTDSLSVQTLRPIADNCGFAVFVGSPDDVLDRFATAAAAARTTWVVRATADNPFLDPGQADALVHLVHRLDAESGVVTDFAAFDGPPIGTGCELYRSAALLRAAREAADPYEREHVGPYVYRNPQRFVVRRLSAPREWWFPDAHLSVDTAADLCRVSALRGEFPSDQPITTERLVAHLRSRHGDGRAS